MSKTSKRALTFVPPSLRRTRQSDLTAKADDGTTTTPQGNVQGITTNVRIPRAPKALAHPANVKPQTTLGAANLRAATHPATQPSDSLGSRVEATAGGVLVTIADHEAVTVLGALLDARDKALKAAELASGIGNEQLADQQLGKAVALEGLCERMGRAFVERRAGMLAKK